MVKFYPNKQEYYFYKIDNQIILFKHLTWAHQLLIIWEREFEWMN